MNSSRVAYAAHSDGTPEGELKALASIYRLVIDSAQKNKAGGSDAGDGAKGSENDRPAEKKYTRA